MGSLGTHIWALSLCVIAIVSLLYGVHVFGGVSELYSQRIGADAETLARVDETIAMHRDFLSSAIWLSLFLFVACFIFYMAAMVIHYRAHATMM